MIPSLIPRRSALYVPGDKARAIDKARGLSCDVVIFDLEDAVAPSAKDTARRQAIEAIKQGGYGARELVIRTNGSATPWGRDDLAAAARSGANAVLLPKVENAAAVAQAETQLAAAGAPDALALWCMIETPRGILRVEEIATSSPRVGCLVMGTTDLATELRATIGGDRAPLLTALSRCLIVARAEGLACLDGVHLDLEDDEGFENECRQGAAMGFDGKTLIHPKTIEAANRLFGPDPEAVIEARKIVAAHAEAQGAGKGVTVLDGKLVEQPHLTAAQRLIALAEKIGLIIEESGLPP